jgi:hypothetical protein
MVHDPALHRPIGAFAYEVLHLKTPAQTFEVLIPEGSSPDQAFRNLLAGYGGSDPLKESPCG